MLPLDELRLMSLLYVAAFMIYRQNRLTIKTNAYRAVFLQRHRRRRALNLLPSSGNLLLIDMRFEIFLKSVPIDTNLETNFPFSRDILTFNSGEDAICM